MEEILLDEVGIRLYLDLAGNIEHNAHLSESLKKTTSLVAKAQLITVADWIIGNASFHFSEDAYDNNVCLSWDKWQILLKEAGMEEVDPFLHWRNNGTSQ